MKIRAFYLDDEPDLCEIFSDQFSTKDIEIITRTDPQSAKVFLASDKVDVVFFDYRLPGTTGDKLAVDLQLQVPVYLITGEMQVKTQFEFHGIIQKPYDFQAIRTALNDVLSKKHSPQTL
jgi:DNA-binding NtrC family response regulator